ncbi:hypothetical protein ACSBR1_033274 [Camellia fascicularis]
MKRTYQCRENSKGVVKTVKDSSFTPQIKGKWTDEEDRKLLKLVRQHGVRKWAQIAEKMLGRAGKQCRERWHSHLRPDIKKDCWSEEEEIMLVEAHKEIGNKWAEIGKQIPGRIENSIKNHWNATKRKLNSKGKIKKSEAQIRRDLTRSTILKDYIKSLNLSDADRPLTVLVFGSFTEDEIKSFQRQPPEIDIEIKFGSLDAETLRSLGIFNSKLTEYDFLQVHKAQDTASKRGKLLIDDFTFLIGKT